MVNTEGPDGEHGRLPGVLRFWSQAPAAVPDRIPRWKIPVPSHLLGHPAGRRRVDSAGSISTRTNGFRPDDVLHWTRVTQNWNYMCAECHSTNLQKELFLSGKGLPYHLVEIDVSLRSLSRSGFGPYRLGRKGGSRKQSGYLPRYGTGSSA